MLADPIAGLSPVVCRLRFAELKSTKRKIGMSGSFDDFNPKLPPLPEACPRCRRKLVYNSPFCGCGFDIRYGDVKLHTSGQCAYCPHNGRLSQEHVFGDWLRRRYAKPATRRRHHLGRPIEVKFFEATEMAQNIELEKKTQPYGNTVYNVCDTCNNTWMSGIHAAAAPVLSRFADGFWPRLTETEQLSLAGWIAMVVVNLESVARISTVTDHQKAELKAGRMPPGFRISAARMLDANSGGDSFHRVIKLPIGLGDDFLQAQVTYFCIERVAFHVTSSIGDRCLELLRYNGISEQFLPRSIWPICDAPTLRTKTRLTKAELNRLQQNLGR